MNVFIQKCLCTVPRTQNIRGGVWWEPGVTVGHQSQIWSLPASWQHFSPWLMFSDDNIWPLKLWLFLAALNGNYCHISSVGLIGAPTQPQSLSHFVCLLLLVEVLPTFWISRKTTLLRRTYSSSLPKANGSFGGRWGIPEVVFIPNGQALLHKTVGREGVGGTGWHARGPSCKTSCGCFYPVSNTHARTATSNCPDLLAMLRNTYTQMNLGMPVFRSRSHLRVALCLLTNFCHIFSQIGWHHIRGFLSLNWDSPLGFCKQRTQSALLSWSSHP